MNIPGWAQRAPKGTPPPPTAIDRPDYCSCIKPPGGWGNHGFHWRLYGDDDVSREVDQALGGLPPGADDTARKRTEEEATKFASGYLGQHLAYEHCPAAQASLAEEIAAKNLAHPRNGRRRQSELVSGLDNEQPEGSTTWRRRKRQ